MVFPVHVCLVIRPRNAVANGCDEVAHKGTALQMVWPGKRAGTWHPRITFPSSNLPKYRARRGPVTPSPARSRQIYVSAHGYGVHQSIFEHAISCLLLRISRRSISVLSFGQLENPYSRARASCAEARMRRSDTGRIRAWASLSPRLAARSRSFAWWWTWSRLARAGRSGVTSPSRARSPRRAERDRHGHDLPDGGGGLSPVRGPGGALQRRPQIVPQDELMELSRSRLAMTWAHVLFGAEVAHKGMTLRIISS
jgi:hypothetical protein